MVRVDVKGLCVQTAKVITYVKQDCYTVLAYH